MTSVAIACGAAGRGVTVLSAEPPGRPAPVSKALLGPIDIDFWWNREKICTKNMRAKSTSYELTGLMPVLCGGDDKKPS
jgi:hypothetical protein